MSTKVDQHLTVLTTIGVERATGRSGELIKLLTANQSRHQEDQGWRNEGWSGHDGSTRGQIPAGAASSKHHFGALRAVPV